MLANKRSNKCRRILKDYERHLCINKIRHFVIKLMKIILISGQDIVWQLHILSMSSWLYSEYSAFLPHFGHLFKCMEMFLTRNIP